MSRSWEDEARTLRERLEVLEAQVDQLLNDAGDDGLSAVFTIQSTGIAVVNAFYPSTMLNITGLETEGTAVTSTTITTAPLLANFGNAVPPPGTTVIGSWVPNRWVFIYNA